MNSITTVGAEAHDMIGRSVEILMGDKWIGPFEVTAYKKYDDRFRGTCVTAIDRHGSKQDRGWIPTTQIRYV